MATFQNTRTQTEKKVMVHLLSEIERNPTFTQRGLSAELGIALGLMNQYLKRCITRGWVRVSQVAPKRIAYFLTPEGFKEKSQMVTDYLARSLTFFRDARAQCEEVFSECKANGWGKVALVGAGDLADIAQLVAQGLGLEVEVVERQGNFEHYDAVMVTDVLDPQGAYESIKDHLEPKQLFTLKLLHISRKTQ